MLSAGIIGIGAYAPEHIMSNHDWEQILETNDEWIKSRTGIERRHFASIGEDTSHMAAEAGRRAIINSNLSPEDIDFTIVATCTPDTLFPSVSCRVQEMIGTFSGGALDVSAACSGFMYAVSMAKQFIETGVYKNILVIGAEKLSKLINKEDRSTAVLFGDGAGAFILSSVSKNRGILSFELGADGTGGKHLFHGKVEQSSGDVIDAIVMNGREVFKFATRVVPKSVLRTIEKAGLCVSDIDYVVPHQANVRIIEYIAEHMKLPMSKFSVTVNEYGNTSSASIPLSLAHDLENGKIKDGDTIVLTGFGGGLTWATVVLRWGK